MDIHTQWIDPLSKIVLEYLGPLAGSKFVYTVDIDLNKLELLLRTGQFNQGLARTLFQKWTDHCVRQGICFPQGDDMARVAPARP